MQESNSLHVTAYRSIPHCTIPHRSAPHRTEPLHTMPRHATPLCCTSCCPHQGLPQPLPLDFTSAPHGITAPHSPPPAACTLSTTSLLSPPIQPLRSHILNVPLWQALTARFLASLNAHVASAMDAIRGRIVSHNAPAAAGSASSVAQPFLSSAVASVLDLTEALRCPPPPPRARSLPSVHPSTRLPPYTRQLSCVLPP